MWSLLNLFQQRARPNMTVHNVHFTLLKQDQAEAVLTIFRDVYGIDRQQDSAAIMKLCCHSTCFGVVAFDSDYPIGFILIQQLGDTGDVIELGVRASLRRQGIGRQLLNRGPSCY